MMQRLLNTMRAQADLAQSGRARTRIGLVSSYDPTNYCAKVRIMPDDVETGWLPVTSPWVGNGWGMFAPPTLGDMVEIQFQENDIDAGFIVGRFYNDSDRPLDVPAGELWLVHQTGAFIKLDNTGAVNINAPGDVNVVAAGVATIKAPSIILKNAGSALKKLCTDVFMTLYNGHTHPAPGGTTGTPNQQATVGTHTTNIVQAE